MIFHFIRQQLRYHFVTDQTPAIYRRNASSSPLTGFNKNIEQDGRHQGGVERSSIPTISGSLSTAKFTDGGAFDVLQLRQAKVGTSAVPVSEGIFT